jgi:hypothetical protein
MIVSETNIVFPLSSVKPLDGLRAYRRFCIDRTKQALAQGSHRRDLSPITGKPLTRAGDVEDLVYGRCEDTGSLFLADLPNESAWKSVLESVVRHRQAPTGFHAAVAGSRAENVYLPKIDWLQSTLRLQGVAQPRVLEITTTPSRFTSLLRSSGLFSDVEQVDEMELSGRLIAEVRAEYDCAVLLESLDRVTDPAALLAATHAATKPGGLVFITASVSSGFDFSTLGFQNLYLYPPDRANCFSLQGLEMLAAKAGFELLERSTPGILDVEIVRTHLAEKQKVSLSAFERELLSKGDEALSEFQTFLQKAGLSSFARLVGRKK